jgi:glycine oxidase
MTEPIEQFDAIVIGGGVIGCAIAWRLGQSGLRVVLVERGEVGLEASYAAGGMLAPLVEADRTDDFFRLAVESRAMYADFAAELNEAGGVDVEYRAEGSLFPAFTDEDEEELDRRWRWQRAAGLSVKRLSADCVRKLEPLINEKSRWALKFPDDHQVNNRLLMIALLNAASRAGVEIRAHTEAKNPVIESQAGKRRVTGVVTSRGEIKSSRVILAAGCWSSELSIGDHFKIEPVRGQMIAFEMPSAGVSHVIHSRRGYIIPRRGGFLIAGSTTEDVGFDKRVTAGGVASIIEHATEIMPCVSELAIIETWAGLRPRASDELPILGQDPSIGGLIYATGHYRNGILLTPITAWAISELVVKGESRIDLAPFSAARFSSRLIAC